jgi:lysyl-tRNA synthetase class 2
LEHFRILAPCLHQIPDEVDDLEKRLQHRHVDLLVNPTSSQTLRLRSKILQVVRSHFTSKGFIEVQTPIISPSAGGAVARPFLTEASSVARGRKLALRIAPELWLKRLVVGGLDRVFEMGPQFRNEGIDATHNPEFTTCEAYMAYGRLDDAIALIEQLFQHCDRLARQLKCPDGLCPNLDPMDPDIQKAINLSFRKLDFIPALEEAMKCPLPDVDRVDRDAVVADLVDLCDRVGVLLEHSLESRTGDNQPRLPQTPAKILDRLATHFLEPQCFLPTFIINHPECMSPLAKSRTNAAGRRISMRCELFVMGREIVNAYEEENSPFQQRVKFRAQMEEAGEDGEGDAQAEIGGRVMDESYCKALEWGLPPTTGLGIGVDRLVMLFSGQERMTDVLSFGGIRGAINQGAAGSAMSSGKKDSKEWELAAAKTNDLELTEDGKFLEVDQALRAVEGVGDMVSELVESMKDRGPGPGPNSESSLSSSS